VRFLVDENIGIGVIDELQKMGHDVVSASMTPGAPDAAVLARAQRDQRVLVTLDKGFGELIVRERLPAQHGVILIRLRQDEGLDARVLAALEQRTEWAGFFWVVRETGVKRRPLEPRTAEP